MSQINIQQLNILTKEQLKILLNTILKKVYLNMKNDIELINLFNKKYNIDKPIENYNKDDLIELIMKFKPKPK